MTVARPKQTTIEDLPKDVLGIIARQLSLKDVAQLSSTNSTIRAAVDSCQAPTSFTYGAVFARLTELTDRRTEIEENIKLIPIPKYIGAMLAAGLSIYAAYTITQCVADLIQEDCMLALADLLNPRTYSGSANEYWEIQAAATKSIVCAALSAPILPITQAAVGFVSARYSSLYALLWADRKTDSIKEEMKFINEEIKAIAATNELGEKLGS